MIRLEGGPGPPSGTVSTPHSAVRDRSEDLDTFKHLV